MTTTIRQDIMHNINLRLQSMINQHNKVLAVRFDVRFPQGYAPVGAEISIFLKLFKEYYNRHGLHMQYVWVREQANSSVHHYHLLVMVNGSLMQNPYGLLKKADEVWAKTVGFDGQGLVNFCNTVWLGQTVGGSTMIRRPSSVATGMDLAQQEQDFHASIARVRTQAVYLAKEETKGCTPYRMREYGCSRLTIN